MTITEMRAKSDDGTFGGTYTADAIAFLLDQIDKRDADLKRKSGLATLYADGLYVISSLTERCNALEKALRDISMWLGYDYRHVGGDIHFLQSQIDEVRDVARAALKC